MRKIMMAVALAFVCLICTAQKIEKESLKANMDQSVKPGDNFWQYAVGNWLKIHPLDKQHPQNGAFTDLAELNNDRINYRMVGFSSSGDSLVNISTFGACLVKKLLICCTSKVNDGLKSSLFM